MPGVREQGHRDRPWRGLAPALAAGLTALLAPASCLATSWADPREEVESALRDLVDGTEHDRYWATVALGRNPDEALHARRPLIGALRDPARRVRVGAAEALGCFGRRAREPWIVSSLVAALQDATTEVRSAAAFALGSIGAPSPAALVSLAACATDGAPEIEVGCAFALARLSPGRATPAHAARTAIELVWASLGDEDGLRTIRFATAAALLSPDAAAASVDRLVARYYTGDANAALALEAYRPGLGGRVGGWRAALASASESGRVSAARALGLMRDPDAATVSLLRRRLVDGPRVPRAAAEALGHIGPAAAAAIPDLSSLVRSRDESLRKIAACALIAISSEAARAVAADLRRTDSPFARWFEARIALSEL